MKVYDDIGECLVAGYLEYIETYKSVSTNIKLHSAGRELDGLAIKDNIVYLCEVAVHINGLRYPRMGNRTTIVEKFENISKFAEKEYPGKKKIYMFWSPIVKIPKNKKSKTNGVRDLEEAKKELKKKGIDLTLVINGDFYKKIDELRDYAKRRKDEMQDPIMRFLQLEARREGNAERSL